MDLAAKNGRKEIVELLLMTHPQLLLNSSFISIADHVPQFSPLHLAARNGKTEIVRLLLDAGFDINLLVESIFLLENFRFVMFPIALRLVISSL